MLFESIPFYSHLNVFRCLCYATNTNALKTKFDAKANCCIFLVYPLAQNGYEVYNLLIFISKDVQFHEFFFSFLQKASSPFNKIVRPYSLIEQSHDNPSVTFGPRS